MKKRKNLGTKIVAIIALGAIVLSVIGTAILFIYEVYFSPQTQQNNVLTPEDLEQIFQNTQIQTSGTDAQSVATGSVVPELEGGDE